jgi:hypothetical protein
MDNEGGRARARKRERDVETTKKKHRGLKMTELIDYLFKCTSAAQYSTVQYSTVQ